jgi:hypothetical protein
VKLQFPGCIRLYVNQSKEQVIDICEKICSRPDFFRTGAVFSRTGAKKNGTGAKKLKEKKNNPLFFLAKTGFPLLYLWAK